jgi:hypothetical protein
VRGARLSSVMVTLDSALEKGSGVARYDRRFHGGRAADV